MCCIMEQDIAKLKKTPVPDFQFENSSHSLKTFIDRYRKRLPVIVQVKEGFCSPDEGKFTFSVPDIYWITDIKTQRRIIGRSADGLNFSIPLDHSTKFYVTEQDGKRWGPSTLENIFVLEDYDNIKNRIVFEPAKPTVVTVWHGASAQKTTKLEKITLVCTYNDMYLVANPVLTGRLYDHRVILPVFLPIKLAVANNLLKPSRTETFYMEIARLKVFTTDFPNSQTGGNSEIMVFTDEQVDKHAGDYEYIDPYQVLSAVVRSASSESNKVKIQPTRKSIKATPPPVEQRTTRRVSGKLPAPPPDEQDQNTSRRKDQRNPQEKPQQISSVKAHIITAQTAVKNVYSPVPEQSNKITAALSTQRTPLDTTKPSKPQPIPHNQATASTIPKQQPNTRDEFNDGDVYAELNQVPRNIDFSTVSKKQVGEFLRLLRLHKYIEAFHENDIDGPLLLDLTKEILQKEFAFTSMEAIKLLKFVHEGWRPT